MPHTLALIHGHRHSLDLTLPKTGQASHLCAPTSISQISLHALADAVARHNEVEFERGGLRFKVHVPDEVDFKLDIEIGEEERELEIEITW
ncbi:MAG: amphi-Trp domain-containing protein [Propionibacteriaceae bacterium]